MLQLHYKDLREVDKAKIQEAKEMLSQEWKDKRADYMSHKITHAEFYLWVAEKVGIAWGNSDEFLGRPLAYWVEKYNGDEWLNNVPLELFDRQFPIYERGARASGMWIALADCTCVYKAIIKQKVLQAAK
jgi:hypothetical protein